ncbi:MAG: glycine C-acetyltransferase [Kistimonas sp.]|nr:glycine C-acetyltransferase [Kistimonas sp.]
MKAAFYEQLSRNLQELRQQGLYKDERVLQSQQAEDVLIAQGRVINLCSNNYLGLAGSRELIEAGQQALTRYGYGMASVRFICGTQDVHRELEERIAHFLGMEDCILYSSCFDANTGLFETLLDAEDAIVSDTLNHASIIDGVRLCKARRYRYANNDMDDLETQLQAAASADCRHKMIVTDGVFSMDGVIANLSSICDLAEAHQALVVVDDSHAVGFIGEQGRGTHEHCQVMGRVDIITGTLGKALGGASGGYTAGKKEVIDWLRNRSRPYLFSNSLCPMIAAVTLKVLDRLADSDDQRRALRDNAAFFRDGLTRRGFSLTGQQHPIIPVMLGDAHLAVTFAQRLLEQGIYVTPFSYPVVPRGQARIRTQVSATHSREQLEKALQAFEDTGRELGVISPDQQEGRI